jgi:hypothetical protein
MYSSEEIKQRGKTGKIKHSKGMIQKEVNRDQNTGGKDHKDQLRKFTSVQGLMRVLTEKPT